MLGLVSLESFKNILVMDIFSSCTSPENCWWWARLTRISCRQLSLGSRIRRCWVSYSWTQLTTTACCCISCLQLSLVARDWLVPSLRSVTPECPRDEARLQRSAGEELLSPRSWSSHLFLGRSRRRPQLLSGKRPSGTAKPDGPEHPRARPRDRRASHGVGA